MRYAVIGVVCLSIAGCTTKHHRESLALYHQAEPLPFYQRTLEWMEAAPTPEAEAAPKIHEASPPPAPDPEQHARELAARVLNLDAARLTEGKALEAALRDRISFEEVLAGVALNNPAVLAARAEWKASLQQYSQAEFLEGLLRQYQSFTRYLNTGVGEAAGGAMLQEFFPAPGAMTYRGEMIREMVRMAELEWEQMLRESAIEAGIVFFEYQFQHRAADAVAENVVLLENLINVVQERYATGLASQVDILRVQTELERQRNLALDFRARQRGSAARLNGLLGRAGDAPLGAPDDSNLDTRLSAPDALVAAALTQRQELQAQQAQASVTEIAIRMGEIMNRPPLSQGYSNLNRGMMPEASVDMPAMPYGAEAVEAMPPARFAQSEAYLGEMRHRLVAQRHQLAALETETGGMARALIQEVEIARRQLALVREVVLPLDRSAYEIALSAYTAGEMTFLDLLDAERKLIETRLEVEESRMTLNLALLELGRISGRIPKT